MNPLLLSAITIFTFFTVFFVVSVKERNYGLVDIGWGLGFIVVLITLLGEKLITQSEITFFDGILVGEILLWGARLSLHIGRRNWKKPEDFRYQAMRKKWEGKWELLKAYVNIFLLQSFFMWVISAAAVMIISSSIDITDEWVIVGVILFTIGFIIEAVADAQLRAFVHNPANKGQLMTSGLWSWSRHPNYFGEALLWWGISLPIIALSYGWIGLLSPLTITLLIRYVSGVPLLEKRYSSRQDFQQYAKKTSVFIPLPPRKG